MKQEKQTAVIHRQFVNPRPVKAETNRQPTETVHGQAMSVAEIMRRFANGLPLGGAKVPIWEGEELVPDFSKMDLADREEAINNMKGELSELQQKQRRKATPKPPKETKTEGFTEAEVIKTSTNTP